MSQIEEKITFITTWYNSECSKLNFGDSLKLGRAWIDICLKDDEYEMASAITKEKKNLIKRHIAEKRSKRTFSQKIVIFIYFSKRKIVAWFSNTLSK